MLLELIWSVQAMLNKIGRKGTLNFDALSIPTIPPLSCDTWKGENEKQRCKFRSLRIISHETRTGAISHDAIHCHQRLTGRADLREGGMEAFL